MAGACLTLGLGSVAIRAGATGLDSSAKLFRVCSDPNNLPFSNDKDAGFENKLAALVAGELGEKVAYTWHAQRRGFIRQTLKANKCDVVMGIPTQVDMVTPTRPYYRSTYVFVSRGDRHLDLHSIKDDRLRHLRIGIQLIGDDGFNTPPAHALSEQGIVDNLVGFTVYGDYRQPNPPARIVTAVENGDVDVAAVWGPLAGYFAKHSKVPLAIAPITDTQAFAPLQFQFDIAMGVRKHDDALKATLDQIILRRQPQIAALLASYGIPTLPVPTLPVALHAGAAGQPSAQK